MSTLPPPRPIPRCKREACQRRRFHCIGCNKIYHVPRVFSACDTCDLEVTRRPRPILEAVDTEGDEDGCPTGRCEPYGAGKERAEAEERRQERIRNDTIARQAQVDNEAWQKELEEQAKLRRGQQ